MTIIILIVIDYHRSELAGREAAVGNEATIFMITMIMMISMCPLIIDIVVVVVTSINYYML